MNVTYRYWQAAGGYPQRVYINAPAHPQIYGQHVRTNGIAWGGKDVTPSEAARLAAALLPFRIDDWSVLLGLVPDEKVSGKRASGGNNGGGRPGLHFGQKGSSASEIEARRIPYTAADSHELDPYNMAHPIPELTTLLVDHREPAEIAQALSLVPNLDVHVTTLDIGDYLVPDRFVIERKTSSDFHASVTEDAKRTFTQTQAMSELGIPALIIIEGGACAHRSMKLNSIYGTLSFISLIQGIPILETLDQHSTVYMIVKTIRHSCYGLGYDLGLRSTAAKRAAKDGDPLGTACFVLEGIPGVSAARARALLGHFGSIRAIAQTDIIGLAEVSGIGRKTAAAIHEALNSPPGLSG